MTNKNNLEELSLSYLVDVVKLNEGFSSKIYKDTKGIETIGYGRNLKDVGIMPFCLLNRYQHLQKQVQFGN